MTQQEVLQLEQDMFDFMDKCSVGTMNDNYLHRRYWEGLIYMVTKRLGGI